MNWKKARNNHPRFLRSTLFLSVLAMMFLLSACGQGDSPDTPAAQLTVEPTATAELSYVVTGSDHPGLSSLRCEECRAVDVLEITGPETLLTSEGAVRLYGAFVTPEAENCVQDATNRLTGLAGSTVRLEDGPQQTDSSGTAIRYVYTETGDSVDEIFVREGIARRSPFDGPHAPWMLITAELARRERAGCIWENFDSMFPQRTPSSAGGLN